MIRAVLDTNVIVSALILKGPTNQLVEYWREGKFKLVISKAILNEYLRVLAYPKFEFPFEEIKGLVERELLPYSEPVTVKSVPNIIPEDPSDDIFLACAKAGRADYLVSGDRHLLSLKRYGKIPIVTVSTFLSQIVK